MSTITENIDNSDGTFKGGFVRDRGQGRGVRVSRAKVSELPIPDPTLAQEASLALAEVDVHGRANIPLRRRRTKLSVMGLSATKLNEGNPDYKRCVKLAKNYQIARTKELYEAYKYVSSGVSALLSAASLALAGSRFLYEVAATAENPAATIKTASSLADSARQNELSAWELCARESVIKHRNAKDAEAMPWEVVDKPRDGNVQADGSIKRSRGRPRKDGTVKREMVINAGQLQAATTEHGQEGNKTNRADLSSLKGQGDSNSSQGQDESDYRQDNTVNETWSSDTTITDPASVLGAGSTGHRPPWVAESIS